MSRRTGRRGDHPDPDVVVNGTESPTVSQQVGHATAETHSKVLSLYDQTVATTKHYYRHLKHRIKTHSPKEYYLLFYNSVTYLLWTYLLVVTIVHLTEATPKRTILDPQPGPSVPETATQQLFESVKGLFGSTKKAVTPPYTPPTANASTYEKTSAYLHHAINTLIHRASTTYSSRGIGLSTFLIQNLAILEVLHSALGLVKSPLTTTGMQVLSRFMVVWWFVESTPAARSSPIYTTMLIAWSLAEMLRSSYYIFSLLHLVPPKHDDPAVLRYYTQTLTWLRYSVFYVLYPVGAGSEYWLMLKGFPSFPSRAEALIRLGPLSVVTGGDALKVFTKRLELWAKEWTFGTWARVPVVFLWPLSLYILMSYMHGQRRKVIGRGLGYGGEHTHHGRVGHKKRA